MQALTHRLKQRPIRLSKTSAFVGDILCTPDLVQIIYFYPHLPRTNCMPNGFRALL